MRGYVYVLSNPSMPGIVKIGRSCNGGRNRAKELYSGNTALPTPFQLEFEIYTEDCVTAESDAHEMLRDLRISDSREFFECDARTAKIIVLRAAAIDTDHVLTDPDTVIGIEDIEGVLRRYRLTECETVMALHPRDLVSAYRHEIEKLNPISVITSWRKHVDERPLDEGSQLDDMPVF